MRNRWWATTAFTAATLAVAACGSSGGNSGGSGGSTRCSAGRGSASNTASLVARMGSATSQIAYTAAKGGLLAASRELGVQFARRGVRVNAIRPGLRDTPMAIDACLKAAEAGDVVFMPQNDITTQ